MHAIGVLAGSEGVLVAGHDQGGAVELLEDFYVVRTLGAPASGARTRQPSRAIGSNWGCHMAWSKGCPWTRSRVPLACSDLLKGELDPVHRNHLHLVAPGDPRARQKLEH